MTSCRSSIRAIMAKLKKREYAIHTADGFLAGYIEAESPSRAIGEALTAWPDLSRREASHPLSASPVVVAGTSGARRKRSYASRSKSGGAKKRRTLTRLRRRVATKTRGHGVLLSTTVSPKTKIPHDASGTYYAIVTSILGAWNVKAWRIASRDLGYSTDRPLPIYKSELADAKREAKASLSSESIYD